MLHRKGYVTKSSTARPEYTPKQPLDILIKRVADYHIAEAIKKTVGIQKQQKTTSSQVKTKNKDKSKRSRDYNPTLYNETQKQVRGGTPPKEAHPIQ
ncbi:hypothetical protein LIER_19330 [Lithospermum erythrorhizon]|uniref:Uncharacterized protein n=1 Tax=Lithospermum erythrorhizon TaxID=34254 RepID=A0AAV3QKF1_LITER